MDFEKKLQGYLYDCVEPFNHWVPWIWLDEGHLMRSNIYVYKSKKKLKNTKKWDMFNPIYVYMYTA